MLDCGCVTLNVSYTGLIPSSFFFACSLHKEAGSGDWEQGYNYTLYLPKSRGNVIG